MTDQADAGATIEFDAEKLRNDVRERPSEGARWLLEFAEKYTVSPVLRNDATILQLEAHVVEDHPDELELVERMIALIDRIVAEHTEAGGADSFAERERIMVQLREYYQRIAPVQERFFVGEGLAKRYTSFELKRFDLTLKVGEITGVVGQNGHGKTTLLRLVAGELQADEGRVLFPMLKQEGKRINWPLVKESIAFVPQELPKWHGDLADTLHYEASLHGIRGENNRRAVNFIVERLGLGGYMDKRWNELSGGYRLRFALARALVWKPRLLVMDEPLANLDIKAKGLLLQDVRDLATSYSHPIAVIMSSHDLHNLESVCNQMVFLQNGEVRFVGDVQSIGEGRDTNEYEIFTHIGLNQLRENLLGGKVLGLRQDGLHILIETTCECKPADLLMLLLSHDVDVQYFRDNSRSVRRLFQ